MLKISYKKPKFAGIWLNLTMFYVKITKIVRENMLEMLKILKMGHEAVCLTEFFY